MRFYKYAEERSPSSSNLLLAHSSGVLKMFYCEFIFIANALFVACGTLCPTSVRDAF